MWVIGGGGVASTTDHFRRVYGTGLIRRADLLGGWRLGGSGVDFASLAFRQVKSFGSMGGGRQMNTAVTSVTEWEMLGEWERSRCRRTVWGVGRLCAVVGHGDFSASAGGMES